jgi:cystathionine beta-lyase
MGEIVVRYDFETTVSRKDMGNLKAAFNSERITEKGFISYWGAEFDFKTAPAILDALSKLVENGLFGYTICTDDYLNRVKWWLSSQRDYLVDKEWVIPTYGTIFSLATTIRAFTEVGDAVIVMTPGYNRYIAAAQHNGRQVIQSQLIDNGESYTIDFDDLSEKMKRPKAKILVVCNPNNPTGSIWKREDLQTIDELAVANDILVFSDEIFSEVVFEGNMVVPYSKIARTDSRNITCTSLGKAFSMTGINHANVIIPNDQVRRAFLRQRQTDHFGSIDPFAHAALVGAYTQEGADWLREMRSYVYGNYQYIDKFFREHFPKVKVRKPEGTYVLWIDFSGMKREDKALREFLFDEALFLLDTGDEYGGEAGFMRMNIAAPRHEIKKSLNYLLKVAKS